MGQHVGLRGAHDEDAGPDPGSPTHDSWYAATMKTGRPQSRTTLGTGVVRGPLHGVGVVGRCTHAGARVHDPITSWSLHVERGVPRVPACRCVAVLGRLYSYSYRLDRCPSRASGKCVPLGSLGLGAYWAGACQRGLRGSNDSIGHRVRVPCAVCTCAPHHHTPRDTL